MKKNRAFWKGSLGIILGLAVVLTAALPLTRTEHLELDSAAFQAAPGEVIQLSQGWVHYQLAGSKGSPLIVLVHGFSVPSYVWDPTAAGLVEEGYRVLSYDLYGRGYSSRPPGDYTIDLSVTQLEELLTALDLADPAVVVGLSMGGPISARYAHQNQDRVKGVVLIAPEVIQTIPGDIFPLNIPGVGEYLMTTVLEPFLLPALQKADFTHPERFPDWEAKYRVQLQYRGTGRALLSTIRHLTELDPLAEYRHLRDSGLPVLLIWGKDDQTITQDHVATLRDELPDLEILVVEEAGHLPHCEKADQVLDALLLFLTPLYP